METVLDHQRPVRLVPSELSFGFEQRVQLPAYILQSKFIVALDKMVNTCTKTFSAPSGVSPCTEDIFRIDWKLTPEPFSIDGWVQFAKDKHLDVGSDPMQYQGLPRLQLAYFERCFSFNVNVYHLRDDGVALAVYKSRCHFDDTMHVNQFDHHLSCISNLPAYTQKYQCAPATDTFSTSTT
jgi:hypothetical protein